MNIFLPLLIFDFLCIFGNGEPLITIDQGILEGTFEVARYGREYAAFLGIPYAKPPVGDFRFRNPEPADNWEGIRPADSFGDVCPQLDQEKIIGNEDCLFLNVYTPLLSFNSTTMNRPLLPVMVWIHGGSFTSGSGSVYGAKFLLDKNIILVTINYRLGILGFLSTGNEVAPGNFGMKDQVLALKWVQQNIKAFGGDPKRVTIFGESAGGASISLHAISKASTGLFSGYIIQSGAVLCPWAYQKSSALSEYVREIGLLFLCPFFNSRGLVNCLRQKPIQNLITTSHAFGTISRLAKLTWTPTDEPDDEGAFLTDNPRNLVEENAMKDLPFMSGAVADEGLVVTRELYSNVVLYNLFKLSTNGIIAYFSNQYLGRNDEIEFTQAVNKFYFNDSMIFASQKEFLDSVTRFITDGFFFYPQVRMVEKVTPERKNPNYFYNFGYRGTMSLTEIGGDRRNLGVSHADELLYLFPMQYRSLQNIRFSKTDEKISRIMVDLWTSFAINRKPTSKELTNSNLWQPYTKKNPVHIQIGNIRNNKDPKISVSNSYYTKRMNFWREHIPL